ncbi:protein of unknown function [Nitrospira japonica]|uniref:Uncharacterized protein n=1 Tax=Nitrospira japonica TaxID=1325564 RepID=A0A1W1I899_9BACT|nr:protein of unknown function [Nitrospira japonica]
MSVNLATMTHHTQQEQTESRTRGKSLLPVCCMCGLIRIESQSPAAPERWVTSRLYEKTHQIDPRECLFTHTYCPGCYTKFMRKVRAA